MQFDLIKEVLTGSITGYITNAIAIKMIFREYGIGSLKLGGVVVKTREEFIDNISSLVEREIINAETLSSELEKETFKDSIEKFVQDLLNVHIYKDISNLHLEEIKGIDSTIGKIQKYIEGCINNNLPIIFDSLCKNINLKQLLNENQVQHISEKLFNNSLDLINNNNFIEKVIDNFYDENKSLNFNEVFGDELVNIISNNLRENVTNFPIELEANFDLEINNAFENTIETLGIHKVLISLEEKLLNKRIIDLVNYQYDINISKHLINKIDSFLKSIEGEELINYISKELLNILKSINKPMLNLFSDNLQYNIERLIGDKLQYIVEDIILWVEKNREEIEELIEEAVDDTIEGIDDDFKKNALNSFKDKFISDGVKKLEIVSKLKEYLKENTDTNSISKDIALTIIEYFREEKVSSIIERLENKGVVTTKTISNYLKHNVIEYIESIPEDYFNLLLNRKIRDIINIDLVDIFETYIKVPVLNLIKSKYIYTLETTNLVTNELIRSLTEINKISFEQLIDKETLRLNYDDIKRVIITQLNNNSTNIVNLFCNEINNSINSISLYKEMDDELRGKILNEANDKILSIINKAIKGCKGIEIKEIYNKATKIENIDAVITQSIQELLKNNLGHILNGNIKKTVANNLYNLKDEELKVMVEQFMGREMKPITIIGAILGAVVGVGMYFFDRSVSQYSYLTSTLISVVVYALVGWITNVQALAMLFKPYTEKRIFGIKIPFTPGVIVSRKPKFAKSMSSFVDEELLNKRSIENLFGRNKCTISSALNQIGTKDDYKIIRDFLNKYSQDISHKIVEYGKEFIQKNEFEVTNTLANEVSRFNLNNFDFCKIKSIIKNKTLIRIKDSNINISKKINSVLRSDIDFSKIISRQLEIFIKNKLANNFEEKLKNLLDFTGSEKERNELLFEFKGKYEKIINRPIKQVVSKKETSKLTKQFYSSVTGKITSQQTVNKIINWLQYLVSKELNPNKKVKELFNGFFVKIIEDNFSYIMDNTIKSILAGISKKQQIIAEVAITSTKENLNFFEIIGYNMFGGDQIISTIVDNLINSKLPVFLDDKKDEFHEMLENFIDNKIYTSTISELDITLEHHEVENTINEIISNSENALSLNNSVIKIVDSVFDWATSLKVQEILNILSINKVEDLIFIFNEELEYFENELKNSINIKKGILVEIYVALVYNIIKNLILSKNIGTLLEGIDHKEIERVSKDLCNFLSNSRSISKDCDNFIQFLIDNKIKDKRIGQFLDSKELNESILCLLKNIIENEQLDWEVKRMLNDITRDITSNNLNIVDDETKQAFLKILINSTLDSAIENFPAILNSLDFKGITEKQINKMEPSEIEELFNSFAEKYFNKLKLYGLGGGVFGLHWTVGIITSILYLGSEIRNKIK